MQNAITLPIRKSCQKTGTTFLPSSIPACLIPIAPMPAIDWCSLSPIYLCDPWEHPELTVSQKQTAAKSPAAHTDVHCDWLMLGSLSHGVRLYCCVCVPILPIGKQAPNQRTIFSFLLHRASRHAYHRLFANCRLPFCDDCSAKLSFLCPTPNNEKLDVVECLCLFRVISLFLCVYCSG